MSRNIELKARSPDLSRARVAAESLGARFAGVLNQIDTYFHCTHGRLKLREINNTHAELIAYHRDNVTSPRPSDYMRMPVPEPAQLRAALESALGVRGQVIKRRELWLWRNVRIHLDDVQRLGSFLELEAVVSDEYNERASLQNLSEIRSVLKISDANLVGGSYSDLLGI